MGIFPKPAGDNEDDPAAATVESQGPRSRLDEALQFLQGPASLFDDNQPARLEFESNGSGRNFRFATPRPGAFTENNVVYGQLYRCSEKWQERPVIILLHGGGRFEYRFTFPSIARRCNQAGYNVTTLVGPYHFQRRPGEVGSWSGRDYLEFSELMAQAVAEIRALVGWLQAQDAPRWLSGCSMGGWMAGLTACRDSRLASVVLTVPAVRMDWRRENESFGVAFARPGRGSGEPWRH